MTLMMKLMLCFYHSQIHDLKKGKVTRAQPLNTPVVSDLGSGLIGALSFTPAGLPEAQAGVPPNVWHLPEGWLIMGTCLDYVNVMACMVAEWTEGDQHPWFNVSFSDGLGN